MKSKIVDKINAVIKRQYFSGNPTGGGGFCSKKLTPQFNKNKCHKIKEFFIKVPKSERIAGLFIL